MSDRAAVVIGVNTTGKLTPLKSAVSEAKRMAAFLKKEGFDVKLLTDAKKPVEAQQVEKAIAGFVKIPTTYRMLVVYFSGHGYWYARSDLWLLSQAPVRTSEAINLSGAIDVAKYSGIPNVVFISDACRSLPVDLGGAMLNGQYAFPNLEEVDTASKVDVFRATSPARAAYEAPFGKDQRSVLTAALLSAYENPPKAMVRTVKLDGVDTEVVPNRLLEAYLQDKVDDLLADIDITLTQAIESDVPSGDEVFIGRVRSKPASAVKKPGKKPGLGMSGKAVVLPAPPPRRKIVGRLAADIVKSTLAQPELEALDNPIIPDAARAVLGEEIAANIPTDVVKHFETQTGFVVFGAVVKDVAAIGVKTDLLTPGDGAGQPAIARAHVPQKPPATAAVLLADGRAFLLAMPFGYIAHCTVGADGLSNVSYVPSDSNWRWSGYAKNRARIDKLRAKVAVAANHGRFSLNSVAEAAQFADEARTDKAIDPTLGLYAAYAYSQSGADGKIRSVLDFMRDDIGADLFDVRMLAFRNPPDDKREVVPPCPMLTQGWNLIGPRRIKLAKAFDGAHAHLAGSLWTTFLPPFAASLVEAVKTGGL